MRPPEVIESTVGARSYENLVKGDMTHLGDWLHMIG